MANVVTKVELFINSTWTDVTSYVDYGAGINITFGVPRENALADPAQCTLSFKNNDARFTPGNTAGPYYPYLTRNIPLRVSAGSVVRFRGYVSEFPIRSNENRSRVVVPVVASGISRRLNRANVISSTLRSAVLGLSSIGDVTGYWPVEDAPGSTSIASALPTVQSGFLTGSPVFEDVDPGVMSKPIATWNAARGDFVPAAGSGTSFTAFAILTIPTGMSGGEEFFRVSIAGTASSWGLLYSPLFGGNIILQVLSSAGEILAEGISSSALDGQTVPVKIEAFQSGGNVNWSVTIYGFGNESGVLATQTVGPPTAAAIGAGIIPFTADVGVGHLILADTNVALFATNFDNGLSAYAGESAQDRMVRLAAQNGVTISTITNAAWEPFEMGVQPDGTLWDVLRAAEKADIGGILYDSLNGAGLTYLTRAARYNDQQPSITLDYNAGHFSPPLEPTDDDQNLRNDVTANRYLGSAARAVLTAGALSVLDYPNGAGPYPFEDTYNTYRDSELPYVAGWLLGLGTYAAPRWPQITLDLVKNPGLVAAWNLIRPGSPVALQNLPAVFGATSADLQCIGWTEQLSSTHRTVTMNCVPGKSWQVMELDDTTFGELDVMRLAL